MYKSPPTRAVDSIVFWPVVSFFRQGRSPRVFMSLVGPQDQANRGVVLRGRYIVAGYETHKYLRTIIKTKFSTVNNIDTYNFKIDLT